VARKPYRRRTDYRPLAERQFSVRAVHRPTPDLTKLAGAFIRTALVNYEKDKAAEERPERPITLRDIEGLR
jgi:hypothetical protein